MTANTPLIEKPIRNVDNAFLFEVPFSIDFHDILWYIDSIPPNGNPGRKETLASGEGPYIGASERRINMPMKKPIRLLGMVFQIDK
jgi:hypothetical protein